MSFFVYNIFISFNGTVNHEVNFFSCYSIIMEGGKSMNLIDGLQNAINYMEDNITEDIDYDKIAEVACSSRFYFQRIFQIVCGYTLGEYIRSRRLSLAA